MTTLEEVATASETSLKIDPFTHISGDQWFNCKLVDSFGLAVCVLEGSDRRIVMGCGPTIELARTEYVAQIKGQTLSIDQFFDTRTHDVPDDLVP